MTELGLVVLGLLTLGGAVALFRFVGCAGEPFTSGGTASPEPSPYDVVVRSHPALVAYWRLGEPSPQLGDPAADELKGHPGSYQAEEFQEDPGVKSPGAPGDLQGGQPGLLESEPAAPSIRVNGGWVAVTYAPALNPAQFTLEALVHPEWPQPQDPAEPKDWFRSVMTSREVVGVPVRGYMLYAGPELDEQTYATVDPNPRWQAWVGDGSRPWWVLGPQVVLNSTTHLAAIYDSTTLHLYVNGTLAGSRAVAYVPSTAPGGVPLYLGAGAPEGMPGPRFPWHGRLQEIALYSAALTTEEVQHHKTLAQTS
jgi:hypothetical protein